jgi:hypothetical protein
VVRIVLDPDEVNQDRVVTLTDGTAVELGTADLRLLEDVARQLHRYRCVYAPAYTGEALDEVRAGTARVEEHSPLYLRVEQLQRQRRSNHRTRREDRELDPVVLLQDRVWVSSSGVERELEELTPSHRRNLLGWLERRSGRLREAFEEDGLELDVLAVGDPWVTATPLYRRIESLVKAESVREQAMDAARQQARRIHFERTGEWPDR